MPRTWCSTTTPSPRTSSVSAASSRWSTRSSTPCTRCTAWDTAGSNSPMGRVADLLNFGPISPFRLRTKLLLLALTTLALPWAGCQYAREMETVLRESEQQSLLAVATTIAGSLKGRQELLFRADSLPALDGSNARDITPVVLSGAPLIDGRSDEWNTNGRNLVRVPGPGGDGLRLLA